MAKPESGRVEQRLAHSLRRVEAPAELWDRVNAAVTATDRPRMPRAVVPALAAALASVAAFALAPVNHSHSNAVSIHRAWTEQRIPLDFYTADASEAAAFAGLPVSFEAGHGGTGSPRPRIEGVRRLGADAVLLALRTGPMPASLLIEAAEAAERKQVAAECAEGYTVYTWSRGGRKYSLVAADAASARVVCRLCHAS
jgi:hypothetical protein